MLVIAGGPNGAGKTTLSLRLMKVLNLTYLGADRVAEQEGLSSTGTDAIQAGRLCTVRIAEALAAGTSILLESTLSGLATRRLIDRFRGAGYDVTVVLVFVDSPDVCIARIRGRVAKGGHFVPDDDVRRRFQRSLRNFWTTYRLQADRWQLHYNGGDGTIEVARGESEVMEVLVPAAFERFRRLLEVPR